MGSSWRMPMRTMEAEEERRRRRRRDSEERVP
jgi:hypothetical protein